jgi:hypothetical protein
MIRRRSFLASGSALICPPACSAVRGPPAASDATLGPFQTVGTSVADVGQGPLSAVIDYQGTSHRYDEAAGKDLGDYVDPENRFIQRCVMSTHDGLPLTVFFRRDVGSGRAEVVFELGRLWSNTPPANLDAYTAIIFRGDRTIFTLKVPQHFWFSRWRWQTAPRPMTGNVSALMASGMLPPYSDRANEGTTRPTRPQSYQVMQLAGLARSMPMTGERDDIGPVTEAQAEYICTGRSSALATLLAQAEAAGTIPWHFRDEHTGAPLNKRQYPHASVYAPDQGDPFIRMGKTGITVDSSHQPALAYVPFLLTGDPYYLETLQFQETFNLLEGPGYRRGHGIIGQERAWAWAIRTLGQLVKVTPATVPRWLLPRSYFQSFFDNERTWASATFVSSDEPERAIFRTMDQTYLSRNEPPIEAGTAISPWQDEFIAFIAAWLVLMGHHDWEAIARWKIGSTIARTDGKSGWVRAHPTPYRLVLRRQSDSPWAQSWADAWDLNKARIDPNGTDPDRLTIERPAQMTYPTYTRGALAMGVHLGIVEAKPCFEWIDGQIRKNLPRVGNLEYKWSVV